MDGVPHQVDGTEGGVPVGERGHGWVVQHKYQTKDDPGHERISTIVLPVP